MTSDGVLLNGFAPNGVAGTNNMSSAASNLGIHWNPKNLEIKTRSVEKTLEPLVNQAWVFHASLSDSDLKSDFVLVLSSEFVTDFWTNLSKYVLKPIPNPPNLLE